MTTTSATNGADATAASGASKTARRPRHTALHWTLVLLTLPGALAVVAFAYLQVLGSAGCTAATCSGLGPNETVFGLILYGTPAIPIIAIVASLLGARRRRGLLIPAVAWALLVLAAVTLVGTF